MDLRSALGSLQVPVAAVGALVFLWAVGTLLAVGSSPAEGEGFVQGLAVFAALIGGQVGLAVTGLGLSIPPSGGFGVRFSRPQRALFALTALGGVAGAVLPLVAFGWLYATAMEGRANLVVLAWGGPLVVAVLSLLAGVGWRAGEAIRARMA